MCWHAVHAHVNSSLHCGADPDPALTAPVLPVFAQAMQTFNAPRAALSGDDQQTAARAPTE